MQFTGRNTKPTADERRLRPALQLLYEACQRAKRLYSSFSRRVVRPSQLPNCHVKLTCVKVVLPLCFLLLHGRSVHGT